MASDPARAEEPSDPSSRASARGTDPNPKFKSELERPLSERCREYRYRFAQCVIFGLPVLALQVFGPELSASADEAGRWVPLLQAVLTGWVCYVGALGMLVEGLIQIRQRIGADLLIASVSVSGYLYSVLLLICVLLHGRPYYQPLAFHFVVIALSIWSGGRWWQTARHLRNRQRATTEQSR